MSTISLFPTPDPDCSALSKAGKGVDQVETPTGQGLLLGGGQ